jgi:hypothetical protein
MRNSSEKRGFSYSCGVFGKAEESPFFLKGKFSSAEQGVFTHPKPLSLRCAGLI